MGLSFRGGGMRGPYSNSVYLAAALGVVGAVLIALWLGSPHASRPGDWKAATGAKTSAAVDGSAFRYGPEINHGRGDTPVYARAQALRDAQATAPYPGDRGPAYQGWSARRSSTTFFNRGLSSGH